MTNSDGVYIEGRRIDTGDCSGPKSARNVLLHPDVDAAVLETARGGVLREGLAFDRCNVAVVTNIGMGDHLGLSYISTVEDLAVVKRVIVENVAPGGVAVLNAADPIVVKMADACPGSVTFFTSDPHHPVMATHRARGLRVVYVDGDAIVAAEGSFEHRIAPGADSSHPERRDRLPGRERDGGDRRRLGAGSGLGNHPRRTGLVCERCGNRARALQPVRLPGRHPDCGLRAQPGCHPGAGEGHRAHAGEAAHGRDQRRGRPAQ